MKFSTNDNSQSLYTFPDDNIFNCWQFHFFDEKGFSLHRCQLFFIENDNSEKKAETSSPQQSE